MSMPLVSVLLSIDGRIDRRTYWLFGILPAFLVWTAIIPVSVAALLLQEAAEGRAGVGALITWLVLGALTIGLFVFATWSVVAVCIKRLRDIGHSVWWVLVLVAGSTFLLPAVAFILYLGLRRGTSV